MSDGLKVWQAAYAMGLLSLFTILYIRGGRSHRAIRVFGGGLTFSLGCVLLAVWSGVSSWVMLLAVPAYPAALSTGYGANQTAAKVRRRARYGLFVGLASAPLLLPLGLWWAWVFQVGLSVATSVFYGVTNPTSAEGEEGAIALLMVATVPFLLIR